MRVLLAVLVFAPLLRAAPRWDELLREALARCDRIRVRSGGTCHRRPDRERTLFEVRDKNEIRNTIAAISIDDRQSGFHCMCCGDPTFEFYAGKQLLGAVGFHHSRSLRWADGKWAGDGLLTPRSAEALCVWLDHHGLKEPLKQHRSNVARDRSRAIRDFRYAKLMGDEMWERIRKSRSSEEAVKILAKAEGGDDAKRALLYLRLLGCHDGAWDHFGGLDSELMDDLLPGVPRAALARALRAVNTDAFAANGAARWIIDGRNTKAVAPDLLEEVLPGLARCALAHPRPASRRRTMIALRKLRGDAAVAALRDALAGTIRVRTLPQDEIAEAAGMIATRGEPEAIRETDDERAVAAFFLAELGDRASLPAIRALARTRAGEARKLLDRAVALLER